MRRRRRLALPAGLEHARQRFERWRGTRGGRRRIPDSLWVTAAQAARRFGVHRTCRALRLNSAVLKSRIEAVRAGGSSRIGAPVPFVELVPAGGARQSECVMELDDPSGTRMRIELKGMSGTDLVALVSSLRGGGS